MSVITEAFSSINSPGLHSFLLTINNKNQLTLALFWGGHVHIMPMISCTVPTYPRGGDPRLKSTTSKDPAALPWIPLIFCFNNRSVYPHLNPMLCIHM